MLVSTVFSRLKMRVTSPPGLTSGVTCEDVLWHPAISAEKLMQSNILYDIFSLKVHLTSGEHYLNISHILELIVGKRKNQPKMAFV
jgi:hypothetical protein